MHKKNISFFHTIFTNIRLLILSLTFIIPNIVLCVQSGFEGFPSMSQDEMEAMEKELEQAALAIEEHVNTLSPEEQEEFHRAVAEVEKMMSEMSEEELGQFFEEVLTQELAAAEEKVSPSLTQQTPTDQIPEETPIIETKPKITSSEQEAALFLIDSIIKHTDEFIIKAGNIPDLSARVKRWIASGKITSVNMGPDWKNIKDTIENFKQKCHKLKEVDGKTNQYIFIEIFTKNKVLYQAFTDLEIALTKHEPLIKVSSFGIEKLSSQSKQSIHIILNAFDKTLLSAFTELGNVFAAYEPTAKKIQESEKKRTERARAESAKQRHPTAPRVGGKSDISMEGSSYPSEDYRDYSFSPYDQQYRPSKITKPTTPLSSQPATPDKPKTDTPFTIKDKKEIKDKDKEKEKDEKTKEKKGLKKKPLKKICTADGIDTPESILQLIKNNLLIINDLIAETTSLSDIKNEITSNKNVNTQLAFVAIPGIERRTKRIFELVKQYFDLIDNDKTKKETLTKELEKNPLFKKLFPQLTQIEKSLKENDALLQQIPADKRYAYFADTLESIDDTVTLKQVSKKIKNKIKNPVSLMNIKKIIDEIKEIL